MIALLKKELWSYFGNWSAWLIIAAFSTVSALFLFFFENETNIFEVGQASLHGFFTLCPWLLMLVIPAISMKSFAEEAQQGTLQWLFAQPLSTKDLVLGKFFAVSLIGILCLLPSLVYLYTLLTLGVPAGNLDVGATLGSYLGLILLIAAFSAIGLWTSCLTSNQIMAYLSGVFVCFIAFFGVQQLANYKLLGAADYYLANLGFYHHYIAFTRGLVDTADIFYFMFVMVLCLVLSGYALQRKR
ncbi:ABC transporter permease [Bergeyella sp. RCAD1439]|uniref:ABC transporter permease n=1 Tax=Bergeyella anatis TaxID=3113737 RepID=UPI002E171704|nr:ABC transporter permease [Bergeyella sp. RCAD1439]